MSRDVAKKIGRHPDFPDEEQLRVWADLMFLAARCPRHARLTAAQLRRAYEPMVMRGQYKIFRFDGIARGMLTFAFLSSDAERRYIAGQPLRPEDWRSGPSLWITDILAPYGGLTPMISRWVMTPGNLTRHSFRFRRVSGAHETRKIVAVDFEAEGKRGRVVAPEASLEAAR
jgi:cytolysin-activating lysine-acyltransferase